MMNNDNKFQYCEYRLNDSFNFYSQSVVLTLGYRNVGYHKTLVGNIDMMKTHVSA